MDFESKYSEGNGARPLKEGGPCLEGGIPAKAPKLLRIQRNLLFHSSVWNYT